MCRLSSPASRAACCAAVGESERRLLPGDTSADHAAVGVWRPELLREAARRATAGDWCPDDDEPARRAIAGDWCPELPEPARRAIAGDGGASVEAGDVSCIANGSAKLFADRPC